MSPHEDSPSTAPNTSQTLREQAEEKLQAEKELLPGEVLGAEETKRLIHELRVHQIELEMQNEQLRESQKELETSRERFVDLYDFAPVGYCTISENGLILEANLTVVTLLGVARNVMIKQAITSFIMAEDQDIYYRHRQALFTTGTPQVCELRLLQKNNKPPIWVRLDATAAQDKDGSPTCRVVLSDITDYKQGETERKQLISAIEQSGESIVITDDKGNIQYVNKTFEKETGYTREEVIGQTSRVMKSGKQDDAFYQKLWATISGGDIFEGQMINKRKDGTLYTEFMVISPVQDEAGTIVNYIANKRDITEYLQLEAQYLQAHKLESIGQLAGGVAHDYNNALSVIMGFTELVMEKVDPTEQIYGDLQEVYTAAKRSADITRQLLTFARKETVVPQVLDLNKNVGGMLKMLHRLIGEDIDLSWQPSNTLWRVKIDPSQTDQILANLCVNARHAITGVGKIVIETFNTRLDDAYCSQHVEAIPGEYVLLMFSDNGCGMSKEDQQKIFEPFFTTKRIGDGTGLGLATVYGIIKQNNGFISVYSELGQGTTFKIYLPRIAESETELSDEPEADPIPQGNGEIVLVVEDEAANLKIVERILGGLGYVTLGATTVESALVLARQHQDAIQLLITDVVMPGMNGRVLAEQLQSICQGIKVLYMSGYSADIITRQGVLAKGVNFLQKPFSKGDLAVKVRKVLAP